MATTLPVPQARIPIGTVNVGGRQLEVMAHPEWLRYLAQSLPQRVGGVTAPSIPEISGAIDALAVEVGSIPLPAVAPIPDSLDPIVLPLQQIDEISPTIEGLQAEIDVLRARVKALEQAP